MRYLEQILETAIADDVVLIMLTEKNSYSACHAKKAVK